MFLELPALVLSGHQIHHRCLQIASQCSSSPNLVALEGGLRGRPADQVVSIPGSGGGGRTRSGQGSFGHGGVGGGMQEGKKGAPQARLRPRSSVETLARRGEATAAGVRALELCVWFFATKNCCARGVPAELPNRARQRPKL